MWCGGVCASTVRSRGLTARFSVQWINYYEMLSIVAIIWLGRVDLSRLHSCSSALRLQPSLLA